MVAEKNIDYSQIDRRRRAIDINTIIAVAFGIVTLIGSLWAYSLSISQDIGSSYADIQSRLKVMAEKVDYLVKTNDQFSVFKELTKDKLSQHDTSIELIKQEVKLLKSKHEGRYNEITTD